MARRRLKRPERASSESGTTISAAVMAFFSAVASLILTLLGTMVGLRADASKESLFMVLTWALYVASFAGAAVLLWILIQAIRTNLEELRHLRGLNAFVPQLIRFNRRSDTFVIGATGNAALKIECEVEAEAGASVPSINIPMLAEVSAGEPEWASVIVNRLCIDGVEHDPAIAYVPRDRRQLVSERERHLQGRIVESGVIRVPVSLEPRRSSTSFVVELELKRAFDLIFEEEMCYTDVSYVTEELSVSVTGADGVEIICSPFSDHRVEAMQLGMELLDNAESQRQSIMCRMSNGVHWRTTNAKLGYRYRLPIRGQRLNARGRRVETGQPPTVEEAVVESQ